MSVLISILTSARFLDSISIVLSEILMVCNEAEDEYGDGSVSKIYDF